MPDQYRYEPLKEDPLKSQVRKITGGIAPRVSREDLSEYVAMLRLSEDDEHLLLMHASGEFLGYLDPWVLA